MGDLRGATTEPASVYLRERRRERKRKKKEKEERRKRKKKEKEKREIKEICRWCWY
jgi:hypothetical protein